MAIITVTNSNDSGTGSLRAALAAAAAGDIVNFAPTITTINLSSSLVISKNIIIEGSQPGAHGTPGVTINGGGSSSNFSDFTINAGVTAGFDGLIIADGHATGATGSNGGSALYQAGGTGGAAAGGIFDAGALTLTNSVLSNDTATGGHGGTGGYYAGGGAGGSAAGAIYVTGTGTLDLPASNSFSNDSAVGGAGGTGGISLANFPGGAGGQGGVSGVNNGTGASGSAAKYGGGAGAPGKAGSPGFVGAIGGGGGGGGGFAFADIGGAGTISGTTLVITNNSDDVNTVGSLRYELAHAGSAATIVFDPSVTTIDLSASLIIATNITIEGAQPGSTTPGVTINGGGSASNFSDFTINAGVTASFDGLIIADGHATGATGSNGGSALYQAGGTGGAAAGGIFDAGALTLTNSVLSNDTATGGHGGTGGYYGGGGAGGSAAGAIYVTGTGTLDLPASNSFSNDSGVGGAGGTGGISLANFPGGAGGQGGVSGVNNGTGAPGSAANYGGGAGGAPGKAGSPGFIGGLGGGGGGGGGSAVADVGGAGTITGPVPCYCPGTLIKTARGEKRVEKLKIGDKVMTASGALRPIKWIGRRSYGGRFIRGDKDILPVCIRAGALDDNVPKRDLWISPHHAMYLDGVLIEAKDLVNGISIAQAERVERVEYFHIELETHDVIVAEGALAESYIDDDNRAMFHNTQDYLARYQDAAAPAHYCAPRLDEGYEVEAARHRIALRAGLLHAADGERIGALRGSIDAVGAHCIAGWAQTADHPEAPVCLDIYADGTLIGQVLANRYREDIAETGLGSGHHGFAFASTLDLSACTIDVRRSHDGAVLARTSDAAAALKRAAGDSTRKQIAGHSGAYVKIHRRAAIRRRGKRA